jgi:glycosyltransferase involved in cell wall biosynthesis
MKIAVNTRLLQYGKLEGIGRFTHEIMSRLVLDHPEVEFTFLFDRPYHKSFIYATNVKPVVIGPPTRHPILWKWWFEKSLPKHFRKNEYDLFLSPDGYASIKANIPTLDVIHDINFEHHPEYLKPGARKYYLKNFRKFAHRADRIGTVSEYSKRDISETYGIDESKIDVIYNGVDRRFKPVSEDIKQSIRNKYTEGAPYFTYIGAFNPRKNITGIIRAFEQFKAETGSPYKLVLGGSRMYMNDEMQRVLNSSKSAKDIIFTGYIPDEELPDLIASAEALLLVSHFEGFGIPLIEAMKSGTVAIAGNNSSMPEIVGDTALLADSSDVSQISGAMKLVASDESVRKELIAKGLTRAEEFTWEQAAESLWTSIKKTLNS